MISSRSHTMYTSLSSKLTLYTLICVPMTIFIFLILQFHAFQWQNYTSMLFNQLDPAGFCKQTTHIKLMTSVTFLPLKDLRFAKSPSKWFMSSLTDSVKGNGSEFILIPTSANDTKSRILCLRGHNNSDGSMNEYALAYKDHLPEESMVKSGMTFISDTTYDYTNPFHSLCAIVPFIGWFEEQSCKALPERWVLYHWGELRTGIGSWPSSVLKSVFGQEPNLDILEDQKDHKLALPVHTTTSNCFEQALVFRHEMGRMTNARRTEVFEFIRCKVRKFCNVTEQFQSGGLRVTMFMRTGDRGFKEESQVVEVFDQECKKVRGCVLVVARPDNLTFCDQVKLMSSTDILVTQHGAQLTNQIFMDKGSRIMEFYPKGWKELAGQGQYVYRWLAEWSGMKHVGSWWDTDGPDCPDKSKGSAFCFDFFKNMKVGHNLTYFAEWARNVLDDVSKDGERSKSHLDHDSSNYTCSCG